VYKYTRKEFVSNCEDSLLNDYVEVDPRSCGGFDDVIIGGVPADIILYNNLGYVLKKEEVIIYTHENGTKTIQEWTSCGGFLEILETKHDYSGGLIFSSREIIKDRNILSSRIEVWSKGKLVKTKYNNINRSIVEKTPCYLKVLEPDETVIIQLDPEKEPPASVQEKIIYSAEVYDVVKYHWYPHCKKYYEAKKLAETNLNQEKEFNTSMKDNDDSLSHTLSYKYYAIIAVCIAIASVAIIRERRRAGK